MAKTPEQVLESVRKKLGHVVYTWGEDAWLNTGVPDLNQVLGDPGRGLPYGRIIEISGLESVGKSALCFSLAAMAQAEGALVVWLDFENSWDPRWATMRGLDVTKVIVLHPYVGTFGDEKTPRMSNAEELWSQAKALVQGLSEANKRIVLIVDSLAAMMPKEKAETALEDQNMRTDQALSKLINKVLSSWVGLAQAHNVLMLVINQLRQNPMARFQDPWYTVGGNAMRFYGHIRVRMMRTKGGRVMQKGKQIGIQGIIRNTKNKSGGLERSELGYKLMFSGSISFVPAKELEKADSE